MTKPTRRKPHDTPTVAAARRVLAAAKAALLAGGKGPAPRAYQQEACESAPRLARRVLELERLVREWRAVAERVDEAAKATEAARKGEA